MKKCSYAIILAVSLAALTACSAPASSSSSSSSASKTETAAAQKETQLQTDSEAPETVAETVSETVQTAAQTPDYSLYEGILGQYASNEFDEYTVFDMDQDGIAELLVLNGTCEADYQWYVYTIEDGAAVQVGTFSGGHSMLYSNASGAGIYKLYGHMGGEVISLLTLSNGAVSEEEISSKQLGQNEEYDTPDGTELDTASVTDYSLLESLQ